MSLKGFIINGELVLYDYDDLADKPTIPAPITVDSALSGTSTNPVQNKVIKVALDQKGSGQGVSDDLKTALLQLAEKVAYIDANGQDYYQDLYDALYSTPSASLTSITAVYTQTGTVYDSASLESLRSNLVVTAYYDDYSSQTVVGYTLSGTLTAGTSTITVTYQGKTTTFTVTVTATPTQYSITNNLTSVTNSNTATTIYGGESYSGTLTPSASDYVITTITITMGGTDITNTAYNSGTISIANVTGNIVITAVATQRVASLSSIDAVFTQGSAVIYDTDSLVTLKQYLVVTANWSDSTTSTVASADYTLSGTLTEGTSTITASYGGKSDTFTVVVTEAPLDTTPVLDTANMNKGQSNTFGNYSNKTGFCPTVKYQLGTLSGTTYDYVKGIIPVDSTGSTTCRMWLYKQDNTGAAVSGYGDGKPINVHSDTMTEGQTQINLNGNYVAITTPVHVDYVDDSYLYVASSGKVLFAGRNTPYYGMENISEAE